MIPPDVDIPVGRVRLRQLRRGDAADFCRIVTTPQVGRMLFVFPPRWSEDEAAEFIDRCLFRGAPPFRLAIADAEGRFVGSIGVGQGAEPDIFYFLDPDRAGGGTMSGVVRAFAAHLFARFGLPALGAQVFTDNPASARVLEKAGFLRIGEGVAASAQRLEPAPVWKYRLSGQA